MSWTHINQERKISDTTKMEILLLRLKGLSYAMIAKQVGVHPDTAWQFCKGLHFFRPRRHHTS